MGESLPHLTLLDWVIVRRPASEPALPLVADLGPGETQVLMLALESRDAVVVLDDALARQVAEKLEIRLTGTLGLLLDAKRVGLIPAVAPRLDKLQDLRFRLAPRTRAALLKLAGEEPKAAPKATTAINQASQTPGRLAVWVTQPSIEAELRGPKGRGWLMRWLPARARQRPRSA
jgi:predicted nucleic acid-binding protein